MIKLGREKAVRVSDVMSTNLIVLDVHMSLGEAAAVLSEHRISGAPVVSGSAKPLGIVSRADLLDPRHQGAQTTVADAMTRVLYAVRPTDPVMAGICDDLVAETADLVALVETLTTDAWAQPTPAAGWSINDTIAHLAFFDGTASLAATDPAAFPAHVAALLAQPDTHQLVLETLEHRCDRALLRFFSHERERMVWIGARRMHFDGICSDDRVARRGLSPRPHRRDAQLDASTRESGEGARSSAERSPRCGGAPGRA